MQLVLLPRRRLRRAETYADGAEVSHHQDALLRSRRSGMGPESIIERRGWRAGAGREGRPLPL